MHKAEPALSESTLPGFTPTQLHGSLVSQGTMKEREGSTHLETYYSHLQHSKSLAEISMESKAQDFSIKLAFQSLNSEIGGLNNLFILT